MNWFEWSINNSLEREYPIVFSALSERMRNTQGFLTDKQIVRDPDNHEFLDAEITRMMVEKYKTQLSQSLDQSTPIFLIDGNNKQESHVLYDLLKQIISRYYESIKSNYKLVEHVKYINPEFEPKNSLDSIRSDMSGLFIREQKELEDRDSSFWAKRSEIWIWSNSIDLLAYSKQNLVFELLSQCIEETKDSEIWGISHCYYINPEWFTHHEQKTLARMLERWYLWSFNNSYCFLKVQNIAWWWKTYRTFWWNHPIQCPHDYLTHSFIEKDIVEVRGNLN